MVAEDRSHCLDAVRAFALLLGIVFHAALSFVPMPNVWPIVDPSKSMVLLALVGISHMFRMQLFFWIAGYFARAAYHRRGAAAFLRDRARRVLLPWALFWPVMAVAVHEVTRWGAARSSGGKPIAIDWAMHRIPMTHLWFLYYLMWIYACAIVAREIVARVLDGDGRFRDRVDAWVSWLVRRHLAPLPFAIALAAASPFMPRWNLGLGMPTPIYYSATPDLVLFVGYGTAFLGGWLAQRQTMLMGLLSERVGRSAGLASLWIAAAWCVALIAPAAGGWGIASRAAGALCGAMATWYVNIALLGYAARRFARSNAGVRYVADASYWLYIAHVPLVMALQGLLAAWPLHWAVKLCAILGATTVVLVLTYHYFVRPTWLGAMLNGRRRPRSVRPAYEASPAW